MRKKYNSIKINTFPVNETLPIKLKYFNNIINNISRKYPSLPKSDISLIVKTLVEELRQELIKGNSIHIRDYLMNMRLHGFCRRHGSKLVFNTRVQIATPARIKNG